MTLTATTEALTDTNRPFATILTDRCAGCQECVIRCPTGTLSMDTEHWVALADGDLCVGCRQCVRTCPFSAVVVEGPALVAPRVETEAVHPEQLLGDTGEIRSGLSGWQEALAEAARCLQCPDPTCVRGCPAHNDIPGFINAIKNCDLEAAHEILRRTTMLPDICSRVCNQSAQCEGACSWSLAGEAPVSIGRLERFITDNLPVPPPASSSAPAPADAELSVGIIGSGPGAAGAAWALLEGGASVTVYEKDAAPGGLCLWGIPDFTLPEAIATRPWRQLVEAGLDLRCGSEIRPEDLDGLLATHDAVILAHGAGVPMRLPVPGADLDGVIDATAFLQGARTALEPAGDPAGFRATLGLTPGGDGWGGQVPEVLVLGAGNTAMDVARTARRLGLRPTCVDWLAERFALARPDELAEARHEGVEVRFSRTLTALHGESGRVSSADLARTTQERADRSPKVLSSNPEVLKVDLVVMAMGYRTDSAFADLLPGTPLRRQATGVPDRRWAASGILANSASAFAHHSPVGRLALGREVALGAAALPRSERVWAVGDALTGPATVVEAMAQGRRAAAAVLDSRPSKPGGLDRAWTSGERRVLVCYESAGGKTARAAEAVADGFSKRGDQVRLLPISKVRTEELAAADLLVIGSWVEGLVVAGVRPAKATRAWLAGLPPLAGRPVGIFCTFGVSPRGALRAMRRAVEEKGGIVVAQSAFGPRELGSKPGAFGPTAFGEELAGQTRIQAALHALVN